MPDSFSGPRILALDLATLAGAAWRVDGVFATRAVDFRAVARIGLKSPPSNGALLDAALFSISSLAHDISPTVFAVERDTGRGAGTELLRGYLAVASIVAARHRAELVTMSAVEVRKVVLGDGSLSKVDAARQAVAYGLVPDGLSGDEVDAVLLLLAVEGRRRAASLTRAHVKRKRAA